MVQEHPRAVHDIPAHAAGTVVMEGEYAEQVAQLEIDPREHDHLQKRNDKKRIAACNAVQHRENAESHRDDKRNTRPRQDRIEQLDYRAPAAALERRRHAEHKRHRQEHRIDDEKHLREDHHAGKQEHEHRNADIKQEQEKHCAEPVHRFRNREVCIPVVLDLGLDCVFPILAIVFTGARG